MKINPSCKYAGEWPGVYVVVAIEWEYAQGDGTLLNISIADKDTIKSRNGRTDGWRVDDLRPIDTALLPSPDTAAAVKAEREPTDGENDLVIDWNFDISAIPRGMQSLLLLERGERGNGELAIGMICGQLDDPIDCYWTWGGPNSGSDVDEVPIAWAPLPAGWDKPLRHNGEPT